MKNFPAFIKKITKNGVDGLTDAYRTLAKQMLQKANIPDRYLSYTDREELIQNILNKGNSFLNKAKFLQKLDLTDSSLLKDVLLKLLEEHNKQFVQQEIQRCEKLFNNILGHSLDREQREAIVCDADRSLIVAGAGAGKTLTIVGKVAYLCKEKKISPDEILLISFTRKAAAEMSERLSKQLNMPVCAFTFHKFAKDIISENTPDVFNIVEQNILEETIRKYYLQIHENGNINTENLLHFLSYYLYVPIEKDEEISFSEIVDKEKSGDLETLRSKISMCGEHMKSQEEVLIANFLYLNGVEYEYEKPYSASNNINFSYKPDFYLPEYDIYLEHFGITRDGICPWLPAKQAKKYVADILKKRATHKKCGTKMLETYSYYQSEGILLSKLRELLTKNKVVLKPRDTNEILQKLCERKDKRLKEFTKLISSFILLFKSQGYNEKQILELPNQSRRKSSYFIERNRLFYSLAYEILRKYQTELYKTNSLDFADLLWKAINLIREEDLYLPYKYVIIDEYQDIGKAGYELVKAILDKTGAKLICIGDDWQSIYRFSGSDVDLFTSFEEYWGPSILLRLKTTYRNAQELLDVCNQFIMCNSQQVSKNLISNKHITHPIKLIQYDSKNNTNQIEMLAHILDEIHNTFKDSSVLILGRYKEDIKFLFNSPKNLFSISKEGAEITYNKCPNLKISFLTVHKAKGLEADNVILLNCKNAYLGFPNKIVDDPIMQPLLSKSELIPYAEERRLMYVALTRTRNYVYLMVPKENPSEFIAELMQQGGTTIFHPLITKSTRPCPLCINGELILREKNGIKFYGCSNFPICCYTSSKLSQ